MSDDPDFQTTDESPDDNVYSPNRKRTESDSNRLLPAMIVVLLALIFAGGIYYFVTRHSKESNSAVDPKITALEGKIASLEKKIADLEGKAGTGSPDPSLQHRVEALSQKVESLEKRMESGAESKTKPSPPKSKVEGQKRYHTVQKGETLSKISRKYGVPVDELRKLNDLSKGEPVRTGQKLLISTEH